MRSRPKGSPKLAKALLFVFVIIAGALLLFNIQLLSEAGCVPQHVMDSSASSPLTQNQVNTYEGMPLTGDSSQVVIEINAQAFDTTLAQDEFAQQYIKPSVLLHQNDSVQFNVTVPNEGDYIVAFDMVATLESSTPEGQLAVNDAFLNDDMQRFLMPVYFRNSTDTFPIDRYGNDALIRQVRDMRWSTAYARDVNFSQLYPSRMTLPAGEHHLTFTLLEGEMYLGSIYLVPFAPYPSYEDYIADQPASDASDVLLEVEAEQPDYKNETSVRPMADRNQTVTPYDTYCLLLNTMGGESWSISGSTVYYEIDVPEDGLYVISFRALQNIRSNFTVYRRITINGRVPFEEFNAIPFNYSPDWVDMQLGGEMPYQIFLHEGVNILGIEATSAPYQTAIETIQEALIDINALALEIRRLTGNQRDPFKEWVISDYIPDIEERLNAIAQKLIDDKNTLLSADENTASAESQTYQVAIDNLLFLADDPDQIPVYMSRFSEGTGSAAQLLGSLLPLLQEQPLAIDKIYIHSPDVTPEVPSVPFATALFEDYRRFLHSFKPDPYQSLSADAGELEVWVNRPRQYVNLLQQMADATFTPKTGIPVKFSIMPDEAKLVLANAADIQPDVALGVSTGNPYELAIRNALYDLRSFDDFDSYINVFSPGALLGYIVNDSVYALPETQDFWVTFYRKDILDSINIPVPQTWDDVIEILPELQRYGLNYNTPLSTGAGQKGYLLTAPYIFNQGADLYTEDGFTGLQDEDAIAAIKFMADSFTIYGMPLTTANFYQDLRYGTLPIGIANTETYIKLLTVAPEVNGLWTIDLYPATVLPDGTQNRYATGSAQTSLMFQNTDMPEEGWEFLKWWMSTETQTEFQEQLILNYGLEYLWFSANVEAFRNLDIPDEHKDVILEQWEWMREPIRLPGGYMQERELSNVWNSVVFEGVNPRVAIDRSVILINREITRKMEEFGYLRDGEQIREFQIPTIETVIAWMENAN